MQDVTVRVIDRGRRYYYLRFKDPLSGRNIERSSVIETGGKSQRHKAEKAAAVLEADLKAGRYRSPSKITWAEFVERYDNDVLQSLRDETRIKAWSVFNTIRRILAPDKLSSLTADAVSRYSAKLRDGGRADETIGAHLRHLKAALNWAVEVGLMEQAPKIRMPKRAKNAKLMKGRPLVEEEFERLLMAVPRVCSAGRHRKRTTLIVRLLRQRDVAVRETLYAQIERLESELRDVTESWRHFIRGLWLSGLRIAESLTLSWDEWADGLTVDTSGKFVMLRIPAESEKGGKDRLLPVAPEFAEMLLATLEDERVGFVFNPIPSRILRGNRRAGKNTASLTVSRIGKTAAVVVDRKGDKLKYASAQDLRRSFGFRWSRRIMPAVLKELMRHEDINTTMNYYVGVNAELTAEALYAAVSGDTFGDTSDSKATAEQGRAAPTY